MYSKEERIYYFDEMIEKIESSELVEGIVQIGSGVIGFNDENSDIDLMIATSCIDNAESTKNIVCSFFKEINPIYIKEKQFSKDIFLLIVIMENKLEFNVSIVPREFLSVKSPLWKVIFDRSGLVTDKMISENEKFQSKPVKYEAGFDIPFEFVYCAMSLEKELRRKNLIYAITMLETMRTYTLFLQAMNENKKLHQFKAYDTLDPSFIKEYLGTYPEKISIKDLEDAAEKLKELFVNVLEKSSFTMDNSLQYLLKNSFV